MQGYKVAWIRIDTQTILTLNNHVITKNHRYVAPLKKNNSELQQFSKTIEFSPFISKTGLKYLSQCQMYVFKLKQILFMFLFSKWDLHTIYIQYIQYTYLYQKRHDIQLRVTHANRPL